MDLEIPSFTAVTADFYGFPFKITCHEVRKEKKSGDSKIYITFCALCLYVLAHTETCQLKLLLKLKLSF